MKKHNILLKANLEYIANASDKIISLNLSSVADTSRSDQNNFSLTQNEYVRGAALRMPWYEFF